MSEHTPGPWRVYRGNVHPSFDGPSPQTTNGDTIICEPLGPDRSANARLIAAAPEMLDALKAAVDVGMVPVSSVVDGGANARGRAVQVADQIRAAIAKAERLRAGVGTSGDEDHSNTSPRPTDDDMMYAYKMQARGRVVYAGPTEHHPPLGEVYDNGQLDPEELAKTWAAAASMLPILAMIGHSLEHMAGDERLPDLTRRNLASMSRDALGALPVPMAAEGRDNA